MASPRWLLAAVLVAACSRGRPPAASSGDTLGPTTTAPATAAAPTGAAAQSPSTGADAAGAPPVAVDCRHTGRGTDYQVGPGKKYAAPGDVPFERLRAGDTVRIFWRAEPYREKLMIGGVGTASQPIRVCGVPGPGGELPVIDGKDATTRRELDFPYEGHQPRGLIIIGHPHDAPYEQTPAYVTLEGLEVRNGSAPFKFTNKAGAVVPYVHNVAGIFLQRGDHITIRGCTVTENGNGIFGGTGGGVELSSNVLIEGNHIHHNGNVDGWSEHNVYIEVSNIVYQYNTFGPTRADANGESLGANIKERSAGVVIRYNWIEGGAHIIDLVDAQEAMATTVPMPSFHETLIYGNVIVRKGAGGSMILYGGDSGVLGTYRKGTLRFFYNTVIVDNRGVKDYAEQDVFEISTNEESLDARNNLFHAFAPSTEVRPVIMMGRRDQITSGVGTFANNRVPSDWFAVDPTIGEGGKVVAQVAGFESSRREADPRFVDAAGGDYRLAADSPLRGAGLPVAGVTIDRQYTPHGGGKPRGDQTSPCLGALCD